MSFSYDFMFDRIVCLLVGIKVSGHLVKSIIQFMNPLACISGHNCDLDDDDELRRLSKDASFQDHEKIKQTNQ